MGSRRKGISLFYIFFISVVLFATSLSSCRTSKSLSTREVKPMSADRVIKRIEKETPKYKYYTADRISVLIEASGEKNNVSAQIKMKKNEQMIIALRKIGFPIGRGLITQDSVVAVNFIDRNYVSGDFSTIRKLFGVDLNYEIIQALITADVSGLSDNDLFERDFISTVDSQLYRLDSEYNRKITRALERGYDRRLSRYMDNYDDDEFYNITAWVCPDKFVIRKIEMNNIKTHTQIVVVYDNFEAVGKQLFPTKIEMKLLDKNRDLKLHLNIGKISIQHERDFTFIVPERYERFN